MLTWSHKCQLSKGFKLYDNFVNLKFNTNLLLPEILVISNKVGLITSINLIICHMIICCAYIASIVAFVSSKRGVDDFRFSKYVILFSNQIFNIWKKQQKYSKSSFAKINAALVKDISWTLFLRSKASTE